jgi:phosphatidylinositol alpha-1,6-mannosyltransferase
MKILFISRAWPPVIGGIERQNHAIATELARLTPVKIVANRHGKRTLPVFIPYALMRALLSLHRYDVVLLGDGVLALVGYIIKRISGKPVACIVHGLDLTFENRIYRKYWVRRFLPRLDKLIAVGNETIHQGIELGIPAAKLECVPNGVSIPAERPDYSKQDLERYLGRKLGDGVLLTLGRLVRRKGVAWFIDEVMPRLDGNITYIIAGTGRDRAHILDTIDRNGLQNRVICIGPVNDRDRELLFCTADIFVQPNIRVPGDMEGFGLVVLEAAAYGMVVIASALEGLKDAIRDGRNGYLVEARNAEMFIKRIMETLADSDARRLFGEQARNYLREHQSWPHIARQYLDVLSTLCAPSDTPHTGPGRGRPAASNPDSG